MVTAAIATQPSFAEKFLKPVPSKEATDAAEIAAKKAGNVAGEAVAAAAAPAPNAIAGGGVLGGVLRAAPAKASAAKIAARKAAAQASAEAVYRAAHPAVCDALPPLLIHIREKVIPDADAKMLYNHKPMVLAAYLALLREIWEAAGRGRGVAATATTPGRSVPGRLAAASRFFSRVAALLVRDAALTLGCRSFWKSLYGIVDEPSSYDVSFGFPNDRTDQSYRCLCKALVLQMMTITFIRMPQSFIAGAPLFLKPAQQKWEWLFARAKQRNATPEQLMSDLEAKAPWVIGPHSSLMPPGEITTIRDVYTKFHDANKTLRENFFTFAVKPFIKFLEHELKAWSASSSAADWEDGRVCHYVPDIAQKVRLLSTVTF